MYRCPPSVHPRICALPGALFLCLAVGGNLGRKFDGVSQVVGREVGIAHRHGDVAVAKDALQREYVAPFHHVMTGEGVPQDVSESVVAALRIHTVHTLT